MGAEGGLDKHLQSAKLPLRSAYCPVNLTDQAIRKDEIARLVRWGNLIKKCGGSAAVIGPNNVKRADDVFADNKTAIVDALNDMCRALDDIGVVGVLHQHTGTCVETRDETYAVAKDPVADSSWNGIGRHDWLGTNRSPECQMFGQFGKTAPQAGGVRDGQVANAGL